MIQIIISPAKQMKRCDDISLPLSTPLLRDKSMELVTKIQRMDYASLHKALKCSDTLAKAAYDTYQTFDFDYDPSPAILTYTGIQYQYMGAHVFTDEQFQYVQNHLWILSGLYGALRPLDGIVPYRLEMQTKLSTSLYTFWDDQLANCIPKGTILNLASEEYAKCIRKYRDVIDVRFCQRVNGKLVEKGVYAKMARGAMVQFMAEHAIEDISQIQTFHELGYIYSKQDSTDTCFVYIKE